MNFLNGECAKDEGRTTSRKGHSNITADSGMCRMPALTWIILFHFNSN